MSRMLVIVLALTASLLAGCSVYMTTPPMPNVTVSSAESYVRVHLNTEWPGWNISLIGVDLQRRNEFDKFVPAGSGFYIPCDRGNVELRIIPHGRCISGEAWLDWDVPSLRRHWDLGPSNWNFSVDNYGDDGPHELIVVVMVQNPGQRPFIQQSTYSIFCRHRCYN